MPRWKMNGAGLAAWALLALSLLLAGCTVPEWQKPGTPRSEIERSMGRPTLSLPLDGGGTRLVSSRQPARPQVYPILENGIRRQAHVHIDPAGVVRRVMFTDEVFNDDDRR
jgi:hypothetical protein